MKKFITLLVSVLAAFNLFAQNQKQDQAPAEKDFSVSIVSDNTVDGVRTVVFKPCAYVCTKQITVAVKGNIVESVEFVRGCSGNAQGVGALIKGMTVDEAIKRLSGINCAGRGTSCPDQLARCLKLL